MSAKKVKTGRYRKMEEEGKSAMASRYSPRPFKVLPKLN